MIPYYSYFYNGIEQHKSLLVIPKTGTTSIRKVFNNPPRRKDPTGEIFTIVRDPFTRSWSAYQECLRRGTFKGSYSDMLTRIELTGHSFDEHTIPQAMYLDKCSHDIDRWFRFEDRDTLNTYLGVILPKENVSKNKCDWDEVLKHIDRLQEIYVEDFYIWNSI